MLKMFDCTVLPILNIELIERLHLKFCKISLVKKSTANVMVYGELGRVPISVHIKSRILNYWFHIISASDAKLFSILYKLMYSMYCNNQLECKWIKLVEENLNTLGLSNCDIFGVIIFGCSLMQPLSTRG